MKQNLLVQWFFYKIILLVLALFSVVLFSASAQTIRVLDVDPDGGRYSGSDEPDTYNLNGINMKNGRNKLNCSNLFGSSGIISHPLSIETAAGAVGSIDSSLLKNYDIVFIGHSYVQTYTSAEIKCVKDMEFRSSSCYYRL